MNRFVHVSMSYCSPNKKWRTGIDGSGNKITNENRYHVSVAPPDIGSVGFQITRQHQKKTDTADAKPTHAVTAKHQKAGLCFIIKAVL